MTRLRLWGLAMVAAVVALGAVGGVSAQGGPEEPQAAGVEVTVWRRVANPSLLYVSTRPEGGSWRTLNTALDMAALSRTRTFHQSNAVLVEVPLDNGATVTVEVTVWRRVSNPSLLYVSTRPQGGSWRTLNTALNMSALSRTRTFHQSNAVLVEVPLPDPPPETSTAPDRSTCTIDEATAARVIASTVQVITPTGLGSAFYIGNSEFVTAGHVVDDSPSSITLRNANISLTASLVGFYPSESGDVAILSASAPAMAALEWAGTLAPGASVAVVGYPEGMGVNASITRGIVSRLFTQQGVAYLQTDSAVSPGNSGGALVDACGRVAGVMSYSIVGERGSEGLHFAIAEPALGRLLQAIRSGQSPPPVEQPPPSSTDPDEPTFWEINAFIDQVSEGWNSTNTEINALVEQWNIINDSVDPPSEQLAELGGRQHDLAAAVVDKLRGLLADPATRNSTASSYLEAAIAYWSERAAYRAAIESYSLAEVTWSAVLRAGATRDSADASYRRAQCALWSVQGYTNAEVVCASADEAESATEEASEEAEARETWEQIDSLIDQVGERWGSTASGINALIEQWNAARTTSRPSDTLAGIAQRQRDLAQGMVNMLTSLRANPATLEATVSSYLEGAISYWSSQTAYHEELRRYALDQVAYSVVQRAQTSQEASLTTFESGRCDLFRLQQYRNAEEVCSG